MALRITLLLPFSYKIKGMPYFILFLFKINNSHIHEWKSKIVKIKDFNRNKSLYLGLRNFFKCVKKSLKFISYVEECTPSIFWKFHANWPTRFCKKPESCDGIGSLCFERSVGAHFTRSTFVLRSETDVLVKINICDRLEVRQMCSTKIGYAL